MLKKMRKNGKGKEESEKCKGKPDAKRTENLTFFACFFKGITEIVSSSTLINQSSIH